MTAKETAERQQDFRARQRLLGLAEVRGIYLPPELHTKLKEHAQKLLKAHEKPIDQHPKPC